MKTFEKEFLKLRKAIITMGSEVERQLNLVIASALEKDPIAAQKVIDYDKDIDTMEMEIDSMCVSLFAQYQPTAFDLRFLTSVIKINNDFERIGDQAGNIAKRLLYLIPRPSLEIEITPMALLANEMVNLGVDSLIKDNISYAQNIFQKEKEMDELQADYYQKLISIMKADARNIKRAVNIMLMTRSFERIGDLATNVAEDIIYYVKASDIRHPETASNGQ